MPFVFGVAYKLRSTARTMFNRSHTEYKSSNNLRSTQIICIFVVCMKEFFLHILVLVAALVCISDALWATDTDYRVSARVGWIMPDGKVDKVVEQPNGWWGPTYSGDLSVTFRPDWQSLRIWNNAGIGVGMSYWHTAHQLLGQGIAPYCYLDIPIVRCPHFILGLRPALGVAFMTKTYTNTVSKDALYQSLAGANQCIGSVFNFYFPEAIYMDFPIARGWSVFVGGGWYHISNGSIRQPNSGYNIFAGEIGTRVSPYPIREKEVRDNVQRTKSWELEMAFTGGGRQVYYRDQQTFFVVEMQAAAYWRAHSIFRLGGGVDVFYDGAYRPRKTYFAKTNLAAARADGSDCWRVGVSVQPEFVVGKFTGGLHIGAYMYDPVRELEPYSEAVQSPTGRIHKPIFYQYNLLKAGSAGYPDGWLYTQVVLRYRLPWHLFIQGTMKSHLTKVEFVSIGLGTWW